MFRIRAGLEISFKARVQTQDRLLAALRHCCDTVAG